MQPVLLVLVIVLACASGGRAARLSTELEAAIQQATDDSYQRLRPSATAGSDKRHEVEHLPGYEGHLTSKHYSGAAPCVV